MRLRRPGFRTAPSALAALCFIALVAPLAGHGRGQSAPDRPVPSALPTTDDLEVVVERTELRWSRSGRLLGRLHRGTPLERLGGRGAWTRVGVHGWMWSASIPRIGGEHRVSVAEENLRTGPNGTILGSLVRGVEVKRVGVEGKWYEVELIGWLPDSAVDEAADAGRADETLEAEGEERATEEKPAVEGPGALPPVEVPVEELAPASSAALSSGAAPAGRLGERVALRSVPGGAVVSQLPKGLVLRPVETRGGWTRVTVEGWVPSASVEAGGDAAASPAAVALSPDAFAGRQVTWTLEHVALQRADAWRTDFEPGEHYDLARVPGGEGRYVYLAVPPGLVDEFRDFSPFETIRVVGRIRTAKSALTGNPIVMVTRILP